MWVASEWVFAPGNDSAGRHPVKRTLRSSQRSAMPRTSAGDYGMELRRLKRVNASATNRYQSGRYAMQSISTRIPSPGKPAA